MLLPYFGIHRLCANGSIGLKQIYIRYASLDHQPLQMGPVMQVYSFILFYFFFQRYLDVYERIHFLGEEVDRQESEIHEEDDARNRRKALRLLHATPTTYNIGQHQIPGNRSCPMMTFLMISCENVHRKNLHRLTRLTILVWPRSIIVSLFPLFCYCE